jgi:acetolactate synthase-1/2/3 large subunit
MSKYSDQLMIWLKEVGYTHCFYVAGGNVMHLLDSATNVFECTPFVHEVGAGIAADYFNESANPEKKAFVLVTAGPGLTNVVTAMVNAWTESRELLVIGGQAKSTELSRGQYRQIGFQEFDGASLCKTFTKASVRIEERISKSEFLSLQALSGQDRKGPVFLEICLDVTTMPPLGLSEDYRMIQSESKPFEKELSEVLKAFRVAKRPIILIGGGVSRSVDLSSLIQKSIPLATTFNGADRVGSEYEFYCGRPNWYGSRWANILLQQSDCVLAIGTRLGIAQVGYNWQEFVPNGKVFQVDIDANEFTKGFPEVDLSICADADQFIAQFSARIDFDEELGKWREFIKMVRADLSGPELVNTASEGFIEAMDFVHRVSNLTEKADVLIPCSSGSAGYEGAMRVLRNISGQKVVTSHGMASMGIGLSGAIGAALANPSGRTITFEGDGGFAQNYQELGTAKANQLNLKIFLMDNGGYMSIKANQRSAFSGRYAGCDIGTGLVLPDWGKVGESYAIQVFEVTSATAFNSDFMRLFNSDLLVLFVVKVDPDQTYWPRLLSTIDSKGKMKSDPLHLMHPPLSDEQSLKYLPYLG